MDEVMRAKVYRSLDAYFTEWGAHGALVKYVGGYGAFEIIGVNEDHDGAYIDPLDAAPHRQPIEWIICLGDLVPTKESDLRAALAAATERAEALQRIVSDFAEATGWAVCEYPSADDIECGRCEKVSRQLYYRRTSVDVDEGDSWCAECLMSEPWDNMASAMRQADALAARLREVEDREHPA